MATMSYPPSPWRLSAHAYVGVFWLRRRDLPRPHAPGTRPITVFGRGLVAAAFFVYEEPSPLTYNEVMLTVFVRDGWRPRVSIVRIWVDSEASRDGGRALWSIPKDLADFDAAPHDRYEARAEGRPFARLSMKRPRTGLPVRGSFRIAQGDADGSTVTTPVHVSGRFAPCRARWWTSPQGPMGTIAGRRPFLTLAAHRLKLVFGD